MMLNEDGVTAFPTYEQLRPWLASMPCAGQASHETVARALTLLRLTRWLSLVRRRRDPKTGRILGNLYVLHDEPLTPFEAMQLDLARLIGPPLDVFPASLAQYHPAVGQLHRGTVEAGDVRHRAAPHNQGVTARGRAGSRPAT